MERKEQTDNLYSVQRFSPKLINCTYQCIDRISLHSTSEYRKLRAALLQGATHLAELGDSISKMPSLDYCPLFSSPLHREYRFTNWKNESSRDRLSPTQARVLPERRGERAGGFPAPGTSGSPRARPPGSPAPRRRFDFQQWLQHRSRAAGAGSLQRPARSFPFGSSRGSSPRARPSAPAPRSAPRPPPNPGPALNFAVGRRHRTATVQPGPFFHPPF